MRKSRLPFGLLLLMAIGLADVSCSAFKSKPPTSKPFYWDIVFTRASKDPVFQRTVFDLDVIGADDALRQKLEATPISAYFAAGSEIRAMALTSGQTVFFHQDEEQRKIAKEDDLFRRWNSGPSEKPAYLIFIANLPGNTAGSAKDGRKLVIPYNSKVYPRAVRSKKSLPIEIVPGQIKSPMMK